MDIAKNKKAYFQYEILEEVEAGIVLVGSEVKSLRLKKISLTESYAVFKRNELYLLNARIEPYTNSTTFNHDPVASRKLLLKKKELMRLKGKLAEKGWVLVPLKMYFKYNRYAKVLLGLGKGKKMYDKRAVIKERDLKREALRELKDYK
ncbi:MAG: SsrA-binding protein SmpB [Leptospirales bacterium]